MTHAADLPVWAAVPTAMFLLIGAGLTLTGSLGLLRLESFYQRVHAPTLGTTLGAGCILIASMIFFSVLGTRLVVHEVLIAIFVTVTTPVTLLLLVRASLYRDRIEGSDQVPPPLALMRAREGGPGESLEAPEAGGAGRPEVR